MDRGRHWGPITNDVITDKKGIIQIAAVAVVREVGCVLRGQMRPNARGKCTPWKPLTA